MSITAKIPETDKKRVVIIGGGFGGLKLARKLSSKFFQVVLVDRNNFHQFQPLLYQVATSGLESSAVLFPLRKIFQNHRHVHFRVAELDSVDLEQSYAITSIGNISFDYLVLATGVGPNFFGNKEIEYNALSMKTISDAIYIRNEILGNFEKALSATTRAEEDALMNVVIVGGGPTGVELAGSLAEMKKHILPKDYPELDFQKMNIYLLEGTNKLLSGMSDNASKKSREFLDKMGVIVRLETFAKGYNGESVDLGNNEFIQTKTLLWAAGVRASRIMGLPEKVYDKGGRILVDPYNRIMDIENIFAIGDVAKMASEKYQGGHPQVAQPAIQQGRMLAKNLRQLEIGKPMKPFNYRELGDLATIGRNLAVADMPFGRFSGFWAWLLWLFVHLMNLVGKKNRFFVFINWSIKYLTYDQSTRLMIKPKQRN